ncbi:MAG: IS1595 family transposase [Propylenella sp.]
MQKSTLSAKRFHDEQAAYDWVESRLWPKGPVCPHCGGTDRISKMQGKSTRFGLYKCYRCRKPFRVTVGTIFEASHIPLHIWLQGIALLSSSKKGISSNQLHRTLGIGLKAAWFMSHRIREAMRDGALAPLGGSGGPVEADETYLWKKAPEKILTRTTRGRPFTKSGKPGPANKRAILSLVERGGSVRSFHVENADKSTVSIIVDENVAREARMHTDESRIYSDVIGMVADHQTVRHSAGEYVRWQDGEAIHTNSAEGFFSIFKRGMKGIYQHCAEKHLHRYLAEFDFRYNNRVAVGVDDAARADAALRGFVGKRLTYRTIN